VNKAVYVHAGTYRPSAPGQALIWFNARHDGVTLEAVGDVTLTAANPRSPTSRRPASRRRQSRRLLRRRHLAATTVLRGFKITGANNYTTGTGDRSPIESDDIRKTTFFYRRWRRHQDLRALLSDDRARRGASATTPARAARACPWNTSASRRTPPSSALHLPQQPDADHRLGVDILHGSRATIDNCLFTGNIANSVWTTSAC
jgi:hypothetical protein